MSSQNSVIKDLEQERAKFAYECALEGEGSNVKTKYKSHVRKVPVLVKTNGLGQTLAFIKYKDDAYKLIYDHIGNWLKKNPQGMLELRDEDDLVQKIICLESSQYRAVTIEVLAFLNWLRRCAEGLIKGEEENED